MNYRYLPLLLLTGCASSVLPPVSETMPVLPAKPNLALRDAVLTPGAVSAYSTGRYADPDDPTVMHEGGTIYREESSPTWNLTPNAPVSAPVETVWSKPSQQRVVLTAELEQKLKQEDELLQTTYAQNQQLAEELKQFQQTALHPTPAPSSSPTPQH